MSSPLLQQDVNIDVNRHPHEETDYLSASDSDSDIQEDRCYKKKCVVCFETLEKYTYYQFDCQHNVHRWCLTQTDQYNYDYDKNYVRCSMCLSHLPNDGVLSGQSQIEYPMHQLSLTRRSDHFCRDLLPLFYPIIVLSGLIYTSYIFIKFENHRE